MYRQLGLRRRLLLIKICLLFLLMPISIGVGYYVYQQGYGDARENDQSFWRSPGFAMALLPSLAYGLSNLAISLYFSYYGGKRLKQFAEKLDLEEFETPDFPELEPLMQTLQLKQKQLEQETQRINWIIRHIPGGLITIDSDEKFTLFNCPAFEELGVDSEEMLDHSISSFHQFIGFYGDESPLQAALRRGTKSRRLSRVKDRYFEAVNTPMINEQGQIDGAVCLFIDVTERVKQEKALKRLEKLHLVGQLAASLGHEMRNPLSVIRGYLQFLSQRDTPDNWQCQFQLMINELDRANRILNEYLALAKDRDSDNLPCSLFEVTRQIIPLLESEAALAGLRLEVNLGETPVVKIDENDVKQLLFNLYRNALEATSPGGSLRIETGVEDNHPFIRVADSGCGIPEQIRDKIGKPFFTTKEDGTGLGLPLCYSIAESHDATLSIHSEAGRGTTVTVSFTTGRG